MKHPHRLLLLLATLAWMTPSSSSADPYAPMYTGSTIEIHGTLFTWDSAIEDSSTHTDTYLSTYGSITIAGVLSPTTVSLVSGTDGTDPIDGHLVSGTYYDNVEYTSGSGTWEIEGDAYTWREITKNHTPNVNTGLVSTATVEHYTGTGNDYVHSYNTNGDYQIDYTVTSTQATSTISNITLFGTYYTFDSGTQEGSTNSTHTDEFAAWTDHYTSMDGGSLDLTYYADGATSLETISGTDPLAGPFSSENPSPNSFTDLDAFPLPPLTGPFFAPPVLMVVGYSPNVPLTWRSGTLEWDGTVTDHYEGWDSGDWLDISQTLRYFDLNDSADVTSAWTVYPSPYTSYSGFGNSVFTVLDPGTSMQQYLYTGCAVLVDDVPYYYAGGYGVGWYLDGRAELFLSEEGDMFLFYGMDDFLEETPFSCLVDYTVGGTVYYTSYLGSGSVGWPSHTIQILEP